LKLLESSTFSNTGSLSDIGSVSENLKAFFHNKGRVLCTYQLLVNYVKCVLEPALAGVGEIDAYLATAKMIKGAEKTNTPYCFLKYDVTSKTPAVDLIGFWSPFCNRQTVKPNTLQLGAAFKTPNIIVTGPNSTGKSTILKGVALSIVMAQSLGIAPAQAMTLTPFEYLVTYMNVADSQVDQESRFQAESRRLFEYGDVVEKLACQGKFSCAFFDEVCSGTSPYEGAKLGYCFGYELAKKPNCLSVIATHFETITQLEKDTNGAFINYQVPVETDKNGNIVIINNQIQRPFKITCGISKQHIACDVFREKGFKSPFWTTLERTINQYDLKQTAAATVAAATLASKAESKQEKS
jgi:DNA mismatch repair protein MutS